MINERAWYNLRLVVSVVFSIACAFVIANVYLDLGYFGGHAKDIMLGIVSAGFLYALFLTPDSAEFRERGWWWKG